MYFHAYCLSSALHPLCISPIHGTGFCLSFPAKHALSLLPWHLTCCVGLSNLPASCQTLPPVMRLVPGRPCGCWGSACHMLGTRNVPGGIIIAFSKGFCSCTLSEASYPSTLSPSFTHAKLNFPLRVACPFGPWTTPLNISSN